MKSFLITLILFGSSFSFVFAQNANKLFIPVLKENKKIDLLMDKVFSNSPTESANVCYVIDLLKTGEKHFSIQIEKDRRSLADTLINGVSIGKDLFGCFLYKQRIIFVWADRSFTDLFAKTPGKKTFEFIHKLPDTRPVTGEYFIDIWHYQYENGEISEEGPPPAQ